MPSSKATEIPAGDGDALSGSSPSNKDRFSFSGLLERFRSFSFGIGNLSPSQGSLPVSTSVVDSPTGEPSNVNSGEPFSTTSDTKALISNDTPEPTFIALKIQSLIDSLPLPTHSAPQAPSHPKPPNHDAKGRPVPPKNAAPIHDSRLIAMLQSATLMNGGKNGVEDRERRVSVWSVLDSMEESSRRSADGDGGENVGGGDEGEGGEGEEETETEASGLMMYSPLMPTNLSLVEIAESGVQEEPQVSIVDPESEVAQVAGWMGMWPFTSVWGTGTGVVASEAVPPVVSPTASIPVSLPGSPSGRSARIRAQPKKRIWIPSPTKISFQAVWWGYRMYLPPPVMDVLNDKSIKAAKRAAVITTALTWFFNNIPLTSLPPNLRPALLLLQTLIPYIGYIGSFISWSWGTIQSYDTGHGVILTATWLLPVALIPSTWDEHAFPPPSPPPAPSQPLPPTEPSLPPSTPAPHPQPSPQAPLPTPPSSPPSAPSPQPSTPVQPPSGLQSPTQSFVTALSSPLQSPSEYIPFSLPQTPTAFVHPSQHGSDRNATALLSPISIGIASPLPLSTSAAYPSPPVLPHASEPLPSWVDPPPPPSPKKIPLPEIEEEEITPRYVFRMLGKRHSKSSNVSRIEDAREKQVKERSKQGDSSANSKEGKGKGRLRAIVGVLGSGKGEGSKSSRNRLT